MFPTDKFWMNLTVRRAWKISTLPFKSLSKFLCCCVVATTARGTDYIEHAELEDFVLNTASIVKVLQRFSMKLKNSR